MAKRLQLRLERESAMLLEQSASERGCHVYEIIREALQDYVEKYSVRGH